MVYVRKILGRNSSSREILKLLWKTGNLVPINMSKDKVHIYGIYIIFDSSNNFFLINQPELVKIAAVFFFKFQLLDYNHLCCYLVDCQNLCLCRYIMHLINKD